MSVSDALGDLPLGVKIRVAAAATFVAAVAVLLLSIDQLIAYATVATVTAILLREWWRGDAE